MKRSIFFVLLSSALLLAGVAKATVSQQYAATSFRALLADDNMTQSSQPAADATAATSDQSTTTDQSNTTDDQSAALDGQGDDSSDQGLDDSDSDSGETD